jgi:hypothetical protein
VDCSSLYGDRDRLWVVNTAVNTWLLYYAEELLASQLGFSFVSLVCYLSRYIAFTQKTAAFQLTNPAALTERGSDVTTDSDLYNLIAPPSYCGLFISLRFAQTKLARSNRTCCISYLENF